jgi:hypothetical protein
MIAERTLAQAAHAWGAQGIPFNDEPKSELFRTASMERATTLLYQSVALRSVMLLSGENGVGKSAIAGRWLRSLEPNPTSNTSCARSASNGWKRGRMEEGKDGRVEGMEEGKEWKRGRNGRGEGWKEWKRGRNGRGEGWMFRCRLFAEVFSR